MNQPLREQPSSTLLAEEEEAPLAVEPDVAVEETAPVAEPEAGSSGGGHQPATPVRPNHELIAALAHQAWVERGLPAEVNWEQAETQLWFTFVRAVDNFRG